MAKNKMADLRNHLFEALERLSDIDDETEPAKRQERLAAVEASGASEFFDAQDRLLAAGENDQVRRGFGKYGLKLRAPKEIA